MTQESIYRKFKIPVDVNNKGRIIIDLPKICPIYEGMDIGGDYKYKITFRKYLMIPLCEGHYEITRSKPIFWFTSLWHLMGLGIGLFFLL